MEQSQMALKLMLDGLNVPVDVGRVDDRKAIQKAVYLAQVAGVDLGYRYNWYRMGPYSPGLTRDYFALAGALRSGAEAELAGYVLRPNVVEKLTQVQPLLSAPAGVTLGQPDWLELVASLHFLLRQRRMDLEAARATLLREKTHVAPFMDVAVEALENGGLIPA